MSTSLSAHDVSSSGIPLQNIPLGAPSESNHGHPPSSITPVNFLSSDLSPEEKERIREHALSTLTTYPRMIRPDPDLADLNRSLVKSRPEDPSRFVKIHNVAENGNLEELSALLKEGPLTDRELCRALVTAAVHDHIEIVNRLLPDGEPYPARLLFCAVSQAVQKGRLDQLDQLFQCENQPIPQAHRSYILNVAVRSGNLDNLNRVLDRLELPSAEPIPTDLLESAVVHATLVQDNSVAILDRLLVANATVSKEAREKAVLKVVDLNHPEALELLDRLLPGGLGISGKCRGFAVWLALIRGEQRTFDLLDRLLPNSVVLPEDEAISDDDRGAAVLFAIMRWPVADLRLHPNAPERLDRVLPEGAVISDVERGKFVLFAAIYNNQALVERLLPEGAVIPDVDRVLSALVAARGYSTDEFDRFQPNLEMFTRLLPEGVILSEGIQRRLVVAAADAGFIGAVWRLTSTGFHWLPRLAWCAIACLSFATNWLSSATNWLSSLEFN